MFGCQITVYFHHINNFKNDSGTQIKTTKSYQLIPVTMAIIKKQEITSVGEDVGKSKLLCTVGGKVIGTTTMATDTQVSQNTKNRTTI